MSKVKRKSTIQRVAAFLLCLLLSAGITPKANAAEARAVPTGSAVILDGQELVCAAYNIGGSNYFKLRDLMQTLDVFVGYDGKSKTIAIDTSKAYIADGSETTAIIAALPKGVSYEFFPATANPSSVSITLNGKPVNWTAYSIYGNNYFKLRDICEALGISVVWDDINNRIIIDTSRGYDPGEIISYPAEAPASQGDMPAETEAAFEAMKAELIRLTNIERVRAGLPELQELQELMNCAQAKADDMRDNRYYGHDSPIYGSCFQMIRSFVPKAKWCTENLAPWTKTPDEAMAAWLYSPSHTSAILDPRATHIGVGIYVRGGGGYTWVQQFAQL